MRVSREDSLGDSRVLVAYYRAVSKHLDSDAQAYLARPPGVAAHSDLVRLQLRVRLPHPDR